MNYNLNISKTVYIVALRMIINVLILFSLLIFTYFTWNYPKYIDSWAEIITTISIVLLFYHVIYLVRMNIKLTDFRIWFIVFLNLFMFGRVYLIAFNLDNNLFWDLLSLFPDELLYISALYVLCSIQGIFIGFTIGGVNSISQLNILDKINSINKISLSTLIYKIGVILLLFATPFQLLEDFMKIRQAQTSSSYLAVTTQSGFIDDFAILFTPGIVFMIASQKLGRKKLLYL